MCELITTDFSFGDNLWLTLKVVQVHLQFSHGRGFINLVILCKLNKSHPPQPQFSHILTLNDICNIKRK